jgi:hypothetical protein
LICSTTEINKRCFLLSRKYSIHLPVNRYVWQIVLIIDEKSWLDDGILICDWLVNVPEPIKSANASLQKKSFKKFSINLFLLRFQMFFN